MTPQAAPVRGYDGTLAGRVIGGVFRLARLIGSGGFADVYLAHDLRGGAPVAVKILHPHIARDQQLARRFSIEFQVAQALTGPHVARALAAGCEPGMPPYVVMEYLDGQPLDEILRRQGRQPVGVAITLIDQVLMALAEAHARGIVHRDIKPDNLMVGRDGVLKVMDFGIARILGRGTVTADGQVLGRPEYMAPEQLVGAGVDHRADLYSAGVVLYELLAGRGPFAGASSDLMATMYRVRHERPMPIGKLRPEIPPRLAAVVERSIAKAPDQRYQSAGEMRRVLASVVGAAPSTQVLSTPTGLAGRSPSPRPSWSIVPAVAVAATMVIVALLLVLLRADRVPTPASAEGPSTTAPKPAPSPAGSPATVVAPPPERGRSEAREPLPVPVGSPVAGSPGAPATDRVAPLPRIAFTDTFDDPSVGKLQQRSSAPANYAVGYEHGEYVIRRVNPAWDQLPYVDMPTRYGDAALVVDAHVVGDVRDRYVALGCRGQILTGSHYRLEYNPELAAIRLARWDADDVTMLVNWVNDPAVERGTAWNRLEFRCVGTAIMGIVNGRVVASARDETYQSGDWFIGASAFSGTSAMAEARFDNLEMRTP